MTTKQSNPKDAIGSNKLPLHLWPETATAVGCLGLLDGMLKYGRSNWREAGVRASIYVDAAKRHLNKWFEGQECDADSGLPHFAHALACLAIMVDARAAGKLIDDRQYPGGYIELLDELTPHVARLKELHAEKSPKHYTIQDNTEQIKPVVIDQEELNSRVNEASAIFRGSLEAVGLSIANESFIAAQARDMLWRVLHEQRRLEK
jgi:hypothetical protein